MKLKSKLLGLASIAALGLVSCAGDELKEAYSGEEISFTTRVARSTPTTVKNLDGFYVYANAEGYSSLLIDGMKADKVDDSEWYSLEDKVTWPVDVNTIYFWAYGPLDASQYVTPNVTAMGHSLNNITVKSDLVNGGVDHKDLVTAYTEAHRQVQVPLTFNHAMSQVEVKIKKGAGAEEGRVVKIKGAWIVNVHSNGNLQFSENASHKFMDWETSTPTAYGRQIAATRLGNITHNVISNDKGGANSGLMVLPQKFTAYSFGKSAEAADNNDDNNGIGSNNAGTYILVSCRVETEHYYPASSQGTAENPAIGPIEGSDGHVHQLFPVVKNSEGQLIYDADAYGYTCVPISGSWEPGKKYVYTLEFCGRNSGAGVYPPDNIPDLPGETPRPDGKEPGDPVLDQAIRFSVVVSDWTEENITPEVE